MRLVPSLALAVGLAVPLSVVQAVEAAPAKAVSVNAVPVTCAGLKATVVGNARNNTITGTNNRDVIVAGAGNDTIRGLGGNDVICGGEGADTLQGGVGNDRLLGEADALAIDEFGRVVKRGDTITGGSGDDVIDPGYDIRPATEGTTVLLDAISYAQAPAAVVVDLRVSPVPIAADGNDTVIITGGGVRIFGSPLGDVIKGTNKADVIHGRGGDDVVFGNGGDDDIVGDSASAPGNDRLYGDAGDDTLTGTLGVDIFAGGTGEDAMSSTSESHQMFRGGGGADTVSFPLPVEPGFIAKGHGGQDRLRLLPNSNPSLKPTLRIDQKKGKTSIRGLVPYTLEGRINGFTDVLLPARTLTIFKGSNDSEIITANADHRVKIYGRGGADVMTGSGEPDRLDGGSGFDIARGRGGNDTCRAAEKRSSC